MKGEDEENVGGENKKKVGTKDEENIGGQGRGEHRGRGQDHDND